MTMRLAAEEITVTIGGERILLRPTLRAALRLERRHGGFGALVSKLQDGNLQAIFDVLREHTSAWSDATAFIASLGAPNCIYTGVEHIVPALVAHVYALAGVDIDAPDEAPSKGSGIASRQTFAEHLGALFRVATGWLGWSPETAWTSTSGEIMAAQRGLIEWVNAQRGATPKAPDNRDLDTKFRDVFSGLRTRVEVA